MSFPIRLLVCASVLTITVVPVRADDIDLFAQINQILGPANLAKLWAKGQCHSGLLPHNCFGIRFRNVRLTQVRVDYSRLRRGAQPDTVVGETFAFRNCSSLARIEGHKTQLKTTEGYTISKSDTVTNSLGANAELNIFGQKAGVTQSETVSFTNSQTTSKTQEKTEEEDVKERVLPYSDLDVTIEKRVTQSYVDFSGVMAVSADIVMDNWGGGNGWDFALGKLSDYVPNAQITLRGQIWNATAEDAKTLLQEKRYNARTCPAGEPPSPTQF